MRKVLFAPALAAALLGTSALTATADPVFNRIASFEVSKNIPDGMDMKSVSSAEIIDASEDGMTLIYSDSPLGTVGFIDISNPDAPAAAGIVKTDGEPTAVAVAGGKALVGVNTSENYTEPSGNLAVIDIASKAVEATCELDGQPDSVAVSPDNSLVAIAIENERDEDLGDGGLPQMPAGFVTIFSLSDGVPDCASRKVVQLTGLPGVGGDDPEPEFVSINGNNEIALTLQENNHIAIIDGESGTVTSHFSAGTVDLYNVDTEEEGALTFDGTLMDVPREPDAVKWLDDDRLVISNEGDWKGGSRGFTIFDKTGNVLYESGLDLEYRIAMAGHYPEARSGNKGAEPEGLEVGTFNGETHIFVLSERSSVVGVYRDTGGAPEFVQLLPSGIGPESAVAIPSRNLLATANEEDLIEDGGVRAHVMVFRMAEGTPAYPQIVSRADATGRPIGWGALSGLAADPDEPGKLYAVNDSFYGMQPSIFVIDANQTPARIVEAIRITRNGQPAQKLDLEGIAIGPDGNFWLASEGRPGHMIPHGVYIVDRSGEIQDEIAFPPALRAVEKRWASEGLTFVGSGDDTTLWIAIQREFNDDPDGMVKLVSYNLASEEWGYVHYPKDPTDTGWIGLSEITAHGDSVYLIERDNQIGSAAKLKALYAVNTAELKPVKIGEKAPVVTKTMAHDFLPELRSLNGYVVDKIEGFTVDAAGNGYAVTDNDGVDDSSGETYFFTIGKM